MFVLGCNNYYVMHGLMCHRLNPVIAANLRELHEDIELMGYLIPARVSLYKYAPMLSL